MVAHNDNVGLVSNPMILQLLYELAQKFVNLFHFIVHLPRDKKGSSWGILPEQCIEVGGWVMEVRKHTWARGHDAFGSKIMHCISSNVQYKLFGFDTHHQG